MTTSHLYTILAWTLTFLLVLHFPSASSQDITFTEEPQDNYYIVKKKPVTITCAARHAVDISFTCGGVKVPPTSVELEAFLESDPEIIKASITVTRADVVNYRKKEKYWCECNAIGIDGQVAAVSTRGTISNAILKYRFKKQPTSLKVTDGESVEFSCVPPVSDPKPVIFWKKDKKRLNMADERFVLSDSGSLLIDSVTGEDAGTYSCVARSPAGRRESKGADLVVAVLAESAEPEEIVSREEGSSGAKSREERQTDKPYFSTEPKAVYYVKPDEELSIDCGVRSANIITFRCNGARMDRKRQDTNQGQDSDGNRILQSQLKLMHSDVVDFHRKNGNKTSFQCQCVGWYQTERSSWSTILSSKNLGVVKLAYLEYTFKRQPSDVTVGLNTRAKLKCEPPKGLPSPWVYWMKDGVKIDPRTDTSYRVSREGSLVIVRAEYGDTGTYVCVAENIVDKVESNPAQLTVSATPPPPTTPTTTNAPTGITIPDKLGDGPVFLQDLPDKTPINEQGIAKLTCITLAATMLTIDCNGRRLSQGEFQIQREKNAQTGKDLMTVTTEVGAGDVRANPDGYSCRCTAWELNSLGKWVQHYGNNGYIVEEKRAFIEDDFVYPPKDQEAHFEDSIEIPCEPPEGNPMPKVYWLKDGDIIKPEDDSNFVVLQAGTLVLEYVRAEDEGMYTCVAENEAGTRRSDPVKLTVKGVPSMTCMQKLQQCQDKLPKMADDPTAICKTVAKVKECLMNIQCRKEYQKEIKSAIDSALTTLSQADVMCSNVGVQSTTDDYYQSSTTGYGSSTDYFGSSSYHGLLEPFYTQEPEPENYILSSRQSVTLRCTIIAAKSLIFVCNGEPLKETASTGFVTQDESGHAIRENSLTITHQQVEDYEGDETISCICRGYAQRDDGEWYYVDSRAGVVENAYLNHDFRQEPKSQKAALGDPVTLTCKLPRGVPKPMAKWVKDGFGLSESDNVVVGENGLMIKMLTEDDVGEYTCVAESQLGQRTSKSVTVAIGTPDEMGTTPMPGMTSDRMVTAESTPESVTVFKGGPYISKDLHAQYFVTKNRPASILCEATGVNDITFECGGFNIDDLSKTASVKEVTKEDGTTDVLNVVEGVISITKQERIGFMDGEYTCVCRGHYVDEDGDEAHVESQVASVSPAFLRKAFEIQPEDARVMEGSFLMVNCQPPDGNPEPEVSWLKNGEPYVMTNLSPGGALVIESATMDDIGEYTCVATNVGATRYSNTIRVEVYESDGMITPGTDVTGTGDGTHMGETTTDDSDIEVVEITKVPLTSDTPDEKSTSYSEYSTTSYMTHGPEQENTSHDMEVSTEDDNMYNTRPSPTGKMSYATEMSSDDMIDTSSSTTEKMMVNTKMTSDVDTMHSTKDAMGIEKTTDNMMTNVQESTGGWMPKEGDTTQDGSEDTTDDNMMTGEPNTTPEPTYHPDTTGDVSRIDNKWRKGVTMVDEYQTCQQVILSCKSAKQKCQGDDSHLKCLENFLSGCRDVADDKVVEEARLNYGNIKEMCEQSQGCSKLAECRSVYYETVTEDLSSAGLPFNLFCQEINNFMQCVDKGLEDCGVNMVSPSDTQTSSYAQISDWFQEYCNRFVHEDLQSCSELTACDLPMDMRTKDNSTYWCSMVDTLHTCINNSVTTCGLDGLDNDLVYLDEMKNSLSCGMTEDMTTGEGGSDKSEASTQASKKCSGDECGRASMTGVSILLVTLIQFALAVFMAEHR